ncbi:MAG: c-type cytochrome, partial [Acetobacteraceae bacterium]
DEFIASTLPTDAAEVMRSTSAVRPGGAFIVILRGRPGRSYQLLRGSAPSGRHRGGNSQWQCTPTIPFMKSSFTLLLALLLAPLATHAQFSAGKVNLDALPEAEAGFEVTMFAREPVLRNACSIAFDSQGRMFVSMGPQYRNPTPETPPDSVVILRDMNGDGVADQAHTFATGFNNIQGLAWHGRDLWVANAPDLTVVRDTNGDDVADEYIRIFTDLGNIEHGLHGLNWAPDGKFYMTKGNSKGLATKERLAKEPDRVAPKPFRELWGVPGPPDAPDFPAPKAFTRETYKSTYHDPADDWGRAGGVLRCDDMGANLEIVARGLRNPYGMGFDHGFDWLGTDQDQNDGDRLFMPFHSADFGWSHRWSTHWTGENHLPTAPISAPVYQGSGTGVIFADAPNWPASHRGVWLINDWLLKSTHVYRPAWDGALLQPAGGKWEHFILPRDALYRPVDMAFGPDGALYVIGWGRGYGVERNAKGAMTNEGRVFRIAPKGMKPLPPPSATPLAKMSVAELQSEFESILPVRRIDAQDELVRRGPGVSNDLMKSLARSQAIETWTLWTLKRLGGDATLFVQLATQSDAALNTRLQALRILGAVSATVPTQVFSDKEPRVRFAAVQAVHQARQTKAIADLVALAAVEQDRLTYYATWHALRDLAGVETLRPLLTDPRGPVRCAALLALLDLQWVPDPTEGKFSNRPESATWGRNLQLVPDETLHKLARDPHEPTSRVAQLGLGKKIEPGPETAPAAEASFSLVSNLKAESGRAYATASLQPGQPTYTDRGFKLTVVPDALRGALMIRTANEDDRSQGQGFLTFDLAMESTVIVAHDTRLKERPAWLMAFQDTDQKITGEDTTFHLWSKDFPAGPVVLGGNFAGKQQGGFANYLVIVQPKPLSPPTTATTMEAALGALKNADPRRGETLFFLTSGCASCHRAGDRGINFGPDLSRLGDRMEAKFIIESMLEPNAVITEGFSAHLVEADGKSYFGTLLSTGRVLKLGLAGGQTVEIASDTITKHETPPVSPMPPQGALLGPQEVADITAWLLNPRGETANANEPSKAVPLSGAPLIAEQKTDRLIFKQGDQPVGEFVFADKTTLRPFFA